ncbi:splicing factor 3A subunit 1, putative [Plasmodium sp. gorilla clade G2]|uniref:splicing factor 3A subunit 1, putative n=1 Tax=Plasmodium sp. gorilla clade G2 TaxID=880535 RepID=UPI000D21FE33|nr:splicing factor 3A subunit 1, putative [Plasmodium sp. gorilla clade G2]SOV19959.1 splicing factor 3A subunit 1, putative [Plasmodium sp. gorilla clade G2]
MLHISVERSLFDDHVDVNDKEVLQKRYNFLEKEMIVPPNNIKTIIDKTATFVKKNGKNFEQKIFREKEKQFGFISPTHPYFYYYQYKLHGLFLDIEEKEELIPHVIKEIKKREDANKYTNNEHILKICDFIKEDEKEEKKNIIYSIDDIKNKDKLENNNNLKIQIQEDIYSLISPFITSLDIDLIKTTALFVARNGKSFLNGLIEREKNNSQYDFLRANNLYFNYFSKLIDIYLKCLLPNDDVLDKIKKYANNKSNILNYSYHLYSHNRKKKEEEERKLEEKNNSDTYYDWNNFSIVETINFDDNLSNLPCSIDFNNVENYVISELFDTDKIYTNEEKLNNISYHEKNVFKTIDQEELYEDQMGEDNKYDDNYNDTYNSSYDNNSKAYETSNNFQNNEYEYKNIHDSDDSENDSAECVIEYSNSHKNELNNDILTKDKLLNNNIENNKNEENIVVIPNYGKSRKHKLLKDKMHKCPLTNQPVDISDMSKHLKTLLLDPQWKEQKDKLYERAKKESSFMPLEDIEGNLSLFVIKRPDLFGSIDEEINDHSTNENKKNSQINQTTNANDVYSYIQTIYTKILPGPAMDHISQNDTPLTNNNIPLNKKVKRN